MSRWVVKVGSRLLAEPGGGLIPTALALAVVNHMFGWLSTGLFTATGRWARAVASLLVVASATSAAR